MLTLPSTPRFALNLFAGVSLFVVLPADGFAQAPAREKIIFGSTYADLADFERFAGRAKQSGATHIDVAQSLPWSYWEYDRPDDPYPSWVISKCGLLKLARPEALRRYVPAEHSERVLAILAERGQVLRRLGLKAVFSANAPSMLPEAVFTDHPLWRGARVDHPARSRVARFAPSIDHPEVLALYREAAAILLRRCPEIDQLELTTNDSGAGLDWSPGLYSGSFGNTRYRGRSMDERLRGFLDAIRAGAQDAGAPLEVRIALTREPEPVRIARKFDRGMAIENLEGPEGTPFGARAGFNEGYSNVFNPVTGIPQAVRFLDDLRRAARSPAPRLSVIMGDGLNRELYFAIFDRFQRAPAQAADEIGRLALLRDVAAERVGRERADELLALWLRVDEAGRLIRLLDTGGTLFYLGSVQQRWLTRPFVPFPAELKPEEKACFRRFQFQALDDAHAESLSDVQATDVYGGWSGRHFVDRVLDPVEEAITESARLARAIDDAGLARRFEIFRCVARNARNAVSYQAQLDRVRSLGLKPEASPVVGTQSSWDRQLIMETAREELDNTAELMALLGRAPGDYLLLAAAPEEEDCRLLGPDIVPHLQLKLNTMNSRWEDYKRLFTTPNW